METEQADAAQAAGGLPVQPRTLAAILGTVILLLFAAYWLFLRVEYVAVVQQIEEGGATSIGAELSARNIPYRVEDDGKTIAVPSQFADRARLEIASSELPLRGQVGFELFNESDMGLTEFAQRINYQRALQGELARTIMLLEGVESARVHIAMPERTLFRGNKGNITAAVTIMPRDGRRLSSDQIAGIQRLVANSVPELAVNSVAILDRSGRAISVDGPSIPESGNEMAAIRLYYHARVERAVAEIAPAFNPAILIRIRPRSEVPIDAGPDEGGAASMESVSTAATESATLQADAEGKRNYAIEIEIRGGVPLDPALRESLSRAIIEAAMLREASGDRLVFAQAPPEAASPTRVSTVPFEAPPEPSVQTRQSLSPAWYWSALFAVSAATLLAWTLIRRRSRSRQRKDDGDFVSRLRAGLASAREDRDAN